MMSKLKEMVRALGRVLPLPLRIGVRRLLWFFMWVAPRIGGIVVPNTATRQRILLVYDTSTQPFSVGDILICQEAALVLCEKYQVNTVDFAILYDPVSPGASNPVFAKAITQGSVMYHLASLLPLVQVNQNLGSFFVFNSREQLVRLIADNADQYVVWPEGWRVAIHEYLNPLVFNKLLVEHYDQHGSIPHLSCSPLLMGWAAQFYRRHVSPQVAVTVNLRNNPAWDTHRNSQIDSWLALFKHCEQRYPVKFVILCARAEIDDRLRKCSNVLLAKDHDSTIEQDLALLQMSAMHMGAGSGPVSMAWFGAKPYLMIDNAAIMDGEFYQHDHMVVRVDDRIRRFWFASDEQRIHVGLETDEFLIREFDRMYRALDVSAWQDSINTAPQLDGQLNSWLR
jgi:hypothetical protein